MTYDDDEATPRERKISRALAVGMHAVFLVLLIFGVSWQKKYSQPVAVVDLWSSMTPPRQETKLKPALRIEPERRITPKPPPKPEVKPIPKPDIALKDKLEKERKVKEQQVLEKKKQQELERKKEDEAKRKKSQQQELEAKKQEEEKRKLEKERLAQEAEAKRLAQEKQQIVKQLADQQAAAQSKLYDKYIALIQSRIRSLIVEPPNLQGNPQVEFDVVIIPGGEVLNAKMRRSSGVPAYDSAVERAILKASPLPVPPDPAVFQQFRELHLKIRPKE